MAMESNKPSTNVNNLEPSPSPSRNLKGTLPRIPLNLSEHKFAITLNWTPIVLTGCILPLILYFTLTRLTSLALNIVLTIPLVLMGVSSLYSLGMRTWTLIKKNSTCRPLGSTNRWAMDYFGWNFLFGFIVLTVIIAIGIAKSSVVVVSLPSSILMLYVCFELVLVEVLMAMRVKAPFRFSSVARGESLRPGSYIIAEDVVAVDAKYGQAFRQAWSDRYEADPDFRRHLRAMDFLWGITGLLVVAAIWAVVFAVPNHEVGFAVGWALPFTWAGVMLFVTIEMSRSMLRKVREKDARKLSQSDC